VLIAERIIGKSIEASPEAVLDIIRDAMSHIVSGETVVLKVSEEDLPAINERYEEWLGLSGNAREFRIEADRRLRRGDCLIETEGGIVDAVIANRLDFIAEEILKQE
jgi:flagellar assembly protein FliH